MQESRSQIEDLNQQLKSKEKEVSRMMDQISGMTDPEALKGGKQKAIPGDTHDEATSQKLTNREQELMESLKQVRHAVRIRWCCAYMMTLCVHNNVTRT